MAYALDTESNSGDSINVFMRDYENQIIQSPNPSKPLSTAIFLAGSISGAEDWQSRVAPLLVKRYNVYNPRRATYDTKAEEEQIKWEWERLNSSRDILFYFSKETVAPITLFEYGFYLNERYFGEGTYSKQLRVYIHREYSRKNDVIIQTRLRRPNITPRIVTDVDHLAEQVKIDFNL